MSRKKIVPKKPEATGFLVVDGLGGFKPVTAEQLLEAARELTAKRLIAYKEMFRGALTSTVVYSRKIVKAALSHNSTSVILTLNHPS